MVEVRDADASRVVRALLAVEDDPEAPLFSTTVNGQRHHVDSAAVNAYLHAHTGESVTAKMFRTWSATVVAAAVMAGADPPPSDDGRPIRRRRLDAVAVGAAAQLLGDTPAVARSAYVHPRVIALAAPDRLRSAIDAEGARLGTRQVADLWTEPAVQSAVLDALQTPA